MVACGGGLSARGSRSRTLGVRSAAFAAGLKPWGGQVEGSEAWWGAFEGGLGASGGYLNPFGAQLEPFGAHLKSFEVDLRAFETRIASRGAHFGSRGTHFNFAERISVRAEPILISRRAFGFCGAHLERRGAHFAAADRIFREKTRGSDIRCHTRTFKMGSLGQIAAG